jgi:hypothetical protein
MVRPDERKTISAWADPAKAARATTATAAVHKKRRVMRTVDPITRLLDLSRFDTDERSLG